MATGVGLVTDGGDRLDGTSRAEVRDVGAGDGIRTRDPQLGKLMLYQLSYSRKE
jgi:hypothetical protein